MTSNRPGRDKILHSTICRAAQRYRLKFSGRLSRPALSLQIQNETVVTQVPKTALFVLIFVNIWYAFLGFCFFLVACYVTGYGGRGTDVRAVQQLLTVTGLVTAAVDKSRFKPGGNLRIGVAKVEDEWRFKVWDEEEDTENCEQATNAEKLYTPSTRASKGLPLVEVTCSSSTFCAEREH